MLKIFFCSVLLSIFFDGLHEISLEPQEILRQMILMPRPSGLDKTFCPWTKRFVRRTKYFVHGQNVLSDGQNVFSFGQDVLSKGKNVLSNPEGRGIKGS